MSGDLNKVTKSFTIILLLMAFILPLTHAQDFTISQGSDSSPICPGSTSLINDIITNNANQDLEFTVVNTGSTNGFSTTVPPGFILPAGKSKTIYSYISPKTSTQPGTYSLDLSVQSGSETQKISHSIQVNDCRSFSLNVIDGSKADCPGDVQKFEFSLVNSGISLETYDLTLEGQIAPWATLSDTSITLNKGESKTIYVYVTTPSDALGNYDFTVVATARISKKVQTVKGSLNVNACFDYTLTTSKDYVSMCENSREVVPVQIKNLGTVSNDYSIELDGPQWASLENNKITIAKDGSENVNVILNPEYGIQGDFDILFKTTTGKGSIPSQNQFNVNVKQCHGVDIQIEKAQDRICNSLSNTYNVNVKNTGDFSKDYKLELIGPVWTSLSSGQINLAAGEEKQLLLTINPGFDVTPGDYDIITRAIALDSSKVSSESKLTISTISKEECYKPVIGLQVKSAEVSYDSSTTIPVVIENKGDQRATYDIGISGTASSFTHLNPAIVTIDPNKAEIVYLYAAPNTETTDGDYYATISVRLKDSTILASDTIKVTVSKSKVPVEIINSPVTEKKSLWQRIVEFFSLSKSNNTPQQSVTNTTELPFTNLSEQENQTISTPADNETLISNETTSTPENTQTTTGVESNLDFSTSSKQLAVQDVNDLVKFKINNEDHTAKVTSINQNTVSIVINSDPINATFTFIGESQTFDINGDGIKDLKVTYMGMKNGMAQLIYQNLIDKPATTTTEDINNETTSSLDLNNTENLSTDLPADQIIDQTQSNNQNSGSNFFSTYFKYVIAGLVILILLILVIRYRKNIKEFFEEEIEEDSAKKPEAKKETPKEQAKEAHKETLKEHPKEQAKEAHKDASKETKKEEHVTVSKKEPHKDASKETKKDTKKENSKEEKKSNSKQKPKKEVIEEYY